MENIKDYTDRLTEIAQNVDMEKLIDNGAVLKTPNDGY